MFHIDRMRAQTHVGKPTKHRTKKYKTRKKTDLPKQTMYFENSKIQKNHKHSKFKYNDVSDYLGPDRLTKHVGFLSKGKISDSISRIEKIMSKEVKARAEQDLQEVLKLSHSNHHKRKKISHSNYESISSEVQSLQSIYKSPQYLNHKTGFASSSWKDKLQKSVGVTSVNSVLASVHEQRKKSPVKELQFIARNVLLQTIHPYIKQANNLVFLDKSQTKIIKTKLCDIKNKFLPCTSGTFETASPSIICQNSQILPNGGGNKYSQNSQILSNNGRIECSRNSQILPNGGGIESSQSSVEDNFHLNPIFTGDAIDQSDFTQIFPSVNEFMNDVIPNNDTVNSTDYFYNSEMISDQTHSSIGAKSSITLVPSSPSSSEIATPVWKLQLSPAKFVPDLNSTPTLYFRHKMF